MQSLDLTTRRRDAAAPAHSANPSVAAGKVAAMAAMAAMAFAVPVTGCDDEVPAPIIRTLDGPTALAFTCYGRIGTDSDGDAITGPMPLAACAGWDEGGWISTDIDGNGTISQEEVDQGECRPPAGQGPDALDDKAACDAWQGNVNVYAFVLQQQAGSLAILASGVGPTGRLIWGLVDGDALSPGINAVPMGITPAGVVTDPSGCFAITANTGTCDLSILDIPSAIGRSGLPQVNRTQVVNSSGAPILAKPRSIVAQPPSGDEPNGIDDGNVCAAAPESLVYVAYPDCNMVAAVDAGTGAVRAGVAFAADGRPVITDSTISCAATSCGTDVEAPVVVAPDAGPMLDAAMVDAALMVDAGMADAAMPDAAMIAEGATVLASGEAAETSTWPSLSSPSRFQPTPRALVPAVVVGTPRPAALYADPAGERLYIGSENSNLITVVELDDDGLPSTTFTIALEGDVGVRSLAATDLIDMGNEGQWGPHRFVYAIATDNTVRVAEVHELRRECDTQIDGRYLQNFQPAELLACLPVGDPALPRRSGATSPGIAFADDDLPVSITFAALDEELIDDAANGKRFTPSVLNGYFAFVSVSTGGAVIVNVDDDIYPDDEDVQDPLLVDHTLAAAHQVRDLTNDRNGSLYCTVEDDENGNAIDRTCLAADEALSSCSFPSAAVGLGIRLSQTIVQSGNDFVAEEADEHLLPEIRAELCVEDNADTEDDDTDTREVAVPELSPMAPDAVRERAFPDLPNVRNQDWSVTWEGPLAGQRASLLLPQGDGGDAFALSVAGGLMCSLGVAPYDIVRFTGCDPELGDAQCGLNEQCYVHPDVPLSLNPINGGICIPDGSESQVEDACRGFMASLRQYSVREAYADRLILEERRRILRTTPVTGCQSDAQCADLAALEARLAGDIDDDGNPEVGTWVCEVDPSRGLSTEPEPGSGPQATINRCVSTCTVATDCDSGYLCSDGYCVAGTVPDEVCMQALQRYEVRVGDAYAVVGSADGFLHSRIRDPDTGACVAGDDSDPLLVGRIPLSVPPCEGDGVTDLSPNPCVATVAHAEEVPECAGGDGEAVRTREATSALRLRNPAMTINLVNPWVEASGQDISSAEVLCDVDSADADTDAERVPLVDQGYRLTMRVGGGKLPLQVAAETVVGNSAYSVKLPVFITRGPLGYLWVADQGATSRNIRGQVLRFNPSDTDIRVPAVQ